MEIFDPLERSIPPSPSENQALKVDELFEEMMSLEAINGRNLNAPLDKKLLKKLHHMIQSQKDKCMELAEKYLKRWDPKDG